MVGEMNDFTSSFSCSALRYYSFIVFMQFVVYVSYLIHGFGWVVGSLVLVRNLPLFDF